jgi:hypothetical protein
LKIPPALVYDEIVPTLNLEAEATNLNADVTLSAPLSEGVLEASAILHPTVSGTPDIDLRIAVSDVPLSTLVPLLVKSGIAGEGFKPKFLWLNCAAKIQGRFQGLFTTSPFRIENCVIDGGGTHVEVDQATRKPDGHWDPFAVRLTRLDLNRLVETLGAKGPDGVADDFGRLTGLLELRDEMNAKFTGAIEEVLIRFSNHEMQSQQKVNRMETEFQLANNRFTGNLQKVSLENGRFDGDVKFDFDRHFRNGRADLEIHSLALDPQVQKVMVGGRLGDLSGRADAVVTAGILSDLSSDIRLTDMEGSETRMAYADVHTVFKAPENFHIQIRTPAFDLRKDSPLFKAIGPVFFAHTFPEEWVPIENAQVSAIVPSDGDLHWEKALGQIDHGHIQIVSTGQLARDRSVHGSISVDYPKVKRLEWLISGTFENPVLKENSKALESLRLRVPEIDDQVLGLHSGVPTGSSTGMPVHSPTEIQ